MMTPKQARKILLEFVGTWGWGPEELAGRMLDEVADGFLQNIKERHPDALAALGDGSEPDPATRASQRRLTAAVNVLLLGAGGRAQPSCATRTRRAPPEK